MTATPSIRIGKLSSRGSKEPWEAGYVSSMRATMSQLISIVSDLQKQIEGASPEIMIQVLQPTFDKSQDYCPIKTGDLKASGYLEVTSFRGSPRVEMGYARGGNPHYAVIVHEDMETYHRPPTRAKWLQAAMLEDESGYLDQLGALYKSAMGL